MASRLQQNEQHEAHQNDDDGAPNEQHAVDAHLALASRHLFTFLLQQMLRHAHDRRIHIHQRAPRRRGLRVGVRGVRSVSFVRFLHIHAFDTTIGALWANKA